jgi:integrase
MIYAARPTHPVSGRRFRIRAATLRDLEAYRHRLDGLRTELKLGMRTEAEVDRELRHLQHGPATLERAAVGYLAQPSLAKNTRRTMRSLVDGHLRPLLARPIASLDVRTVRTWIKSLARVGLRKGSIETNWHKLRSLVRFALERGWIGALPWGHWTPTIKGAAPKPPREAARQVHEIVALLRAARALDLEARFGNRYYGLEAAIALAGLLGLRQGELAGLRWDDLDLGAGACAIFIARQYAGAPLKNKRPVLLETIPEVGTILERHRCVLERRRLFAVRGPVFPHRIKSKPGEAVPYGAGEVLTVSNLRAAVRLAGLPNVTAWSPHSLRDTFVTLEVHAAGGDLARVLPRSRHATLPTLLRYVRKLERNNPASPALRLLPGLKVDEAGGPMPRLLAAQPPKETPP